MKFHVYALGIDILLPPEVRVPGQRIIHGALPYLMHCPRMHHDVRKVASLTCIALFKALHDMAQASLHLLSVLVSHSFHLALL